MAYKYSVGPQTIADLTGSADSEGDTVIDFEEDYIGFITSGSSVMVVSGSRVGIGTTTPDYTLDVAGNIGVNQYIYHNGDSNTYMDFPSNDNITFAAGGSEELKITDGAILVKQYIKHDGDENTHMQFADNKIILKAGNLSFFKADKKDSAPHEITLNDGSNNIDFVVKGNGSGEGNPGMKFDASTNKLGINGVGTPDESLHVDGNIKVVGDDPRIKIDGDTDSHPGLELYENGTRKWIIFNDYTNDNLTFKTNSNTRMSIEQAGNVGIGTTSPIAELDVAGKIAITAEVATPTAPANGKGWLYAKTDGKIYWQSNDVAETDLTATGGGGGGSGDALEATAQKTTNYTASNWDFVLVNLVGASGDVTITLPAASSDAQVAVKIAGAANGKIVTVDGNGAETIDGAATRTMDSDYESMHLISDGSNWWRIA